MTTIGEEQTHRYLDDDQRSFLDEIVRRENLLPHNYDMPILLLVVEVVLSCLGDRVVDNHGGTGGIEGRTTSPG